MNVRTSKPLRRCPSLATLEAELDSAVNEPALVEHIEQCAECRRLLDELAAEPSWWSEAGDTLATRPAELSHLTESICPLSTDRAESAPADPLYEHEIAQLQRMLPAASHPELLARIGRYDLEQLIGRGGMGLVFRARDTELHRVVAVKTLALVLMPVGTARERFIREGRAAAMLNHPNVVPMYDVITEPPVPALVMQLIAGPTLESWIAEHGPMPWQNALRIGAQLADALDAAHTEGLVHRDIKPSNVLLEADGTRALLTDFGLVRAIDDAALTHSGMLAGTPHFMSPEQARGDDVDGRSDLFSLGSLLYFAMTGQPPFRAREPMAVLNHLCHTSQVPLCQVDREIPIEVSRLVDRLLSKQMNKRPASSRAVRDELRTLLLAPRRLRRTQSFQQSFKSLARRPVFMVLGTGCALLVAISLFSLAARWSDVRSEDGGSLAANRFEKVAADVSVDSSAIEHGEGIDANPQDSSSDSGAEFDAQRAAGRSELSDFERLARASAELEAMIDAFQFGPTDRNLDDFTLRQTFETFSREAASIDAELEQLRARQADAVGSSVSP